LGELFGEDYKDLSIKDKTTAFASLSAEERAVLLTLTRDYNSRLVE
jgi:hypothetical protein